MYLLNFQIDAPKSQVVSGVITSQMRILTQIVFTVVVIIQHSIMFYFFLVLIHKGLLQIERKTETPSNETAQVLVRTWYLLLHVNTVAKKYMLILKPNNDTNGNKEQVSISFSVFFSYSALS